MLHARRVSILLTIVFVLSAIGCDTPATVSQFCGSATATLATATPVFEDMKASCLREVNSRQQPGTFTPLTQHDASCDRLDSQVAGAIAAATVLSDYFNAINSLASFGTAKAGTDAQSLVSQTGAAVGASSAAQTALGSIAQFLVSAATAGYQQKQLAKDLPAVSKNIAAVSSALIAIVRDNYEAQLLNDEELKLANKYKEFAKNAKSPEAVLMLDDRWRTDEQALAAKRASAECLIAALQALSQGTADLAANANHLTAKEIPGLLDPYVTQLQTLIPQIQKGF